MSAIENRIKKNEQRLKGWAKSHQITAYRLYDRDIPDFPYMVDRYGDYYVIHIRSSEIDKEIQKAHHFEELIQALKNLFGADSSHIVIKERRREKFKSAPEKKTNFHYFTVSEYECHFLVLLDQYLDTGLFLDHRPLRRWVAKRSPGKRFLNLFSYTGSMSLASAMNGGFSTSVDMSKTYQNWAQKNFKKNGVDLNEHQFVCQDVKTYLLEAQRRSLKFDIICLDPPTFSNSKKLTDSFEVERDHLEYIRLCMRVLDPSGIMYFSHNKRKFHLAKELLSEFIVKDLTEESIPLDFHDKKCHQCYSLSHVSQ